MSKTTNKFSTEVRARGERIGALFTGAWLVGSFVVGMAASFVAVLIPFAIVIVVALEGFRCEPRVARDGAGRED